MWVVDPSRVMSELRDGEAVIVELSTGRQYVVTGVAVTVWEGILVGHSLERIMDDVRRSHMDVPADAEHRVKEFVVRVVDSGLAVPSTEILSTADARSPISGEPTPWSTPVLELRDVTAPGQTHPVQPPR